MPTILVILLAVVVIIGYRIFRIKTYINELNHFNDLRLILPFGFYVEQAILLFGVILGSLALDPVPAIYAIAAGFGIIADTILTVFYYSAKCSKKISNSLVVNT